MAAGPTRSTTVRAPRPSYTPSTPLPDRPIASISTGSPPVPICGSCAFGSTRMASAWWSGIAPLLCSQSTCAPCASPARRRFLRRWARVGTSRLLSLRVGRGCSWCSFCPSSGCDESIVRHERHSHRYDESGNRRRGNDDRECHGQVVAGSRGKRAGSASLVDLAQLLLPLEQCLACCR